jgi:small-conductance mechanosensitive channel
MDALLQFFIDGWNGLRNPDIALQIVLISLCTVLGWGGAIALRKVFSPNQRAPGVGSLTRVMTPGLILILILLARQLWFKGAHQGNLLRIVIPLVASLAVMRFGFYLVRRIFSDPTRVESTLTFVEKLLAVVVWAGGLVYISGLWPELLQFLESTTIPIGRHKVSLATVLETLSSVLVMLTLALWAGAVLEQHLMKMEVLQTSSRVVMARVGRALLILIGLLISLVFVGIDLTVLSVFGGALGVGLGLGLQKITSNYVSGFVILLDGSLKIGDMITVDKYVGRVTQINTRYTILQGLDGIESVLPNEMLVSGPVQNYSLSNSRVRLGTRVTVPFCTDLDSLLPLLALAALEVPRVQTDPKPEVAIIKVGGDGLELELGFWISDPENGRGGVISGVNRAIWRVLKQQGILLETSTQNVIAPGR